VRVCARVFLVPVLLPACARESVFSFLSLGFFGACCARGAAREGGSSCSSENSFFSALTTTIKWLPPTEMEMEGRM
jgi:hypothetical protein